MKEELYKKISIDSIDDLPKGGLYFCAITDSCFGSFHFNPDDKDDIDFWMGNVMWYLVPIEPVEAEKETNLPLVQTWSKEWLRDDLACSNTQECNGPDCEGCKYLVVK